MRRVLLPILMLYVTVGAAKWVEAGLKPPTEKAAFAATRNLVRALNTLNSDDRVDALRRYVDSKRITQDMFGDAARGGTAADRSKLAAVLSRILIRGLFNNLPKPKEIAAMKLSSRELPGGRRAVEFQVGKDVLRLVWVRGARSPMLADLEHPTDGLMTASVRRRWSESGHTPVDFLSRMMGATEKPSEASAVVKSKDNIRTLLTLMIARRIGSVSGGYPPYSGKAFILSLIATNQLDRRNKANLEVLFSPGDKRLSLTKTIIERYKDVTKSALKNAAVDLGELTSYAGRRNGEREYLVTPDQEAMGTPLIADLSFPDVAIVGFSNGAVRVMTRQDLGLGPKGPIVAGDGSESEVLRKLSDL